MLLIGLFITIASIGLAEIVNPKSKNILLSLCFVFLLIVISFRNMGGSDFELFQMQYSTQRDLDGWEEGYKFLSSLFHNWGLGFSLFLLAITFISLLLIFDTIRRYSTFFVLSVIMYVGSFMIYYNIIALRQMIALALIVYSYRYIMEQKLIYFVLFLLCAFFFHKSSLIFILAYPFCTFFRVEKIYVCIFFIVSFLIGQIINFNLLTALFSNEAYQTLLDERLSKYTDEIGTISYSTIIKVSFVLFMIRINYNKISHNQCFVFLTKLYVLYCGLFLIFNQWPIFMRMYVYFEISSIFVVAHVVNYIRINNKGLSFIFYLLVAVLYGFAMITNVQNFDRGALLSYSLTFIN